VARLTTARLDLVPLRIEDADEMVEVLADERLYRFIGGLPPTLDGLRDRYARLVGGRSPDKTEAWHNWIVRRREDGRAVGTVQATIRPDGRTADIAWVIGLPWQGSGYASEAAIELVRWLRTQDVGTITARIHPDHLPSAAVAQRAGLRATDEIDDGERVWRLTLDPVTRP
jgi:RimJ/RimL family protein N-acetyltransferase